MPTRKPTHMSFESDTERGPFIKIACDMMRSPAWTSLSIQQQGLYLRLKSKYRQLNASNGTPMYNNSRDISMPTSEVKSCYGAVTTYQKDMHTLIDNGLIDLVERGRFACGGKACNKFGFSDRWKAYGKPFYRPPTQNVPLPKRREQ